MDQAIIQCLESLASKYPEYEERLEQMKENYRKRMWFLLTDQIQDFIRLPQFSLPGNTDLVPLYDSMLKHLTTRIS